MTSRLPGDDRMNTIHVSMTQIVCAPVETLFNLWLDPTVPGGPWYGATELIFNPAVGGLFYFSIAHDGRAWPHYGRFEQIDRNAALKYTWVSEATRGVESVVSVTFTARDAATTEIVLSHAPLPDDAMGQQHQDGWALLLAKLGEKFVTQAAVPVAA
jgi:uncharacterized protein YndB with AHSA1/START domain